MVLTMGPKRNEFRKTENRQLNVPSVAALFVSILSVYSLSGLAKPVSQPSALDNSDFQIKEKTQSQPASWIESPGKTSKKVQPPADTTGKKPETLPAPQVMVKPQEHQMPLTSQASSFETSFTSWPASGKQPIAAILSIH